jgi:DNA (cytosine-5)-methyltransferase 1
MCNGGISSQNNVHPGHDNGNGTYSDARVLSIHELLLICGIPTN